MNKISLIRELKKQREECSFIENVTSRRMDCWKHMGIKADNNKVYSDSISKVLESQYIHNGSVQAIDELIELIKNHSSILFVTKDLKAEIRQNMTAINKKHSELYTRLQAVERLMMTGKKTDEDTCDRLRYLLKEYYMCCGRMRIYHVVLCFIRGNRYA